MSDFAAALRSDRVLVMDGAMGTELMRRTDSATLACGEAFNLTDPELVRSIHRDYVTAGTDVVLTNTFQANPAAIARHGLADRCHDIWTAAIQHALAARPRFVLAAIGPIAPLTQESADRIVAECKGVDGILLETWSAPETISHFATSDFPLLVSFTFQRLVGRTRERRTRTRLPTHPPLARPANSELITFTGAPPEECARAAQACGAIAVGANCGKDIGMHDMLEIVGRYRTACDLPIFVRPNAGTPDGKGVYPHTPEALAAGVRALLAAGVRMVGGCCGTTPSYIAQLRREVDA